MLLQNGRFTAERLEKLEKMSSNVVRWETELVLSMGKAISGHCKVRKGKSAGEALAKFLKNRST